MAKREKLEEIESKLREFDSFTPEEVASISASEKQVRSFHPEIARVFGNTYRDRDIALFLCQVKHFWDLKGRNPFHKYNSPCSVSIIGDSWEEELSMTRDDLRAVKDVVSTKVRNAKQAEELIKNGTTIETLVVYHRNSDRVTFWYFNDVLYAKLRAAALKEFPNRSKANGVRTQRAQVAENPTGPSGSHPLASYTEPQQNINIEEKEIYKEKETEFANMFDTSALDMKKKAATNKQKTVNKEKANKGKKTLTLQQQSIIADQTKGYPVPLDFSLDGGIMNELVKDGYIRDQLASEAKAMASWFNINQPQIKKVNWSLYFKDKWVPRSEVLEKNGQVLNKNANARREDSLRELAEEDIFASYGTDLSKLINDLDDERGAADDENNYYPETGRGRI